jgi:C4-dicarboxylate transporter
LEGEVGDFMTRGKWFLVGSIGVAAVLFAVAIVLGSGVAALIAFALLMIALFGRHFVR